MDGQTGHGTAQNTNMSNISPLKPIHRRNISTLEPIHKTNISPSEPIHRTNISPLELGICSPQQELRHLRVELEHTDHHGLVQHACVRTQLALLQPLSKDITTTPGMVRVQCKHASPKPPYPRVNTAAPSGSSVEGCLSAFKCLLRL